MGCSVSTQRETTSEPGFDHLPVPTGRVKASNTNVAGKQRGSPVNCQVKSETRCADHSPVTSAQPHRHCGMSQMSVSFVSPPLSSNNAGRRFSQDRHCGSQSNTSRANDSPSNFMQKSPSLSASLSTNSASLSEYPVPLGNINNATAMTLTNRVMLLQWLDGEQYLPDVLMEFDRRGICTGDDAVFAVSSEQSCAEHEPSVYPEGQLTRRDLAKNHLFQVKAEYRAVHLFYTEERRKK